MNVPATCTNERVALASKSHLTTVAAMTMPRRKSASTGTKRGETMNALAKLIQSRRAELDLTWEEMAKRGGFSGHSVLYTLATKKEHKSPPRPETIKRIAKACGVSVDVVRAAAVEAAGYTLEDIEVPLDAAADIRVVAMAMGQLDDADRKRIARFVESFVADIRE